MGMRTSRPAALRVEPDSPQGERERIVEGGPLGPLAQPLDERRLGPALINSQFDTLLSVVALLGELAQDALMQKLVDEIKNRT